MKTCANCNSTEFYLSEGSYYCTECHIKTQTLLLETHGTEDLEDLLENLNESQKEATEEFTITSWEQYNYILLGLVNQLIDLGAPEELKLTALQLWAEHLRRNEVAFFEKNTPTLPKLSSCYYSKDAELVYNRFQSKIKKTSTKKKSVAKNRAKRAHAKNEYEAFISNQESDLEQSLQSASVKSFDSGSQKLKLAFSRKARKVLKRSMNTQHLLQHENDVNGLLKCHKGREGAPKLEKHLVNQSSIMAILVIALNLVESNIQIADMIRFMNENHITVFDISEFLPENISRKAIKSYELWKPNYISAAMNYYFRTDAAQLCKFLNVRELKTPNIFELCQRYILDLALPKDIEKMIEQLITLSPPKMIYKNDKDIRTPNYEGRAMSYIIFVLKLIFGMDDSKENKMSMAVERINDERKCRPVFNIRKWMRYIEMRQIIIQKFHYPSFDRRKTNFNYSSARTSQYLDFLEDTILGDDDCGNFNKNLNDLMEQVCNQHQVQRDRENALNFPVTFTPCKDYYEFILEKKPPNLFVPEFMKEYFPTHDLMSYINAKNLKEELLSKKIKLRTAIVKSNASVKIIKPITYGQMPDVDDSHSKTEKLVNDITIEEWRENMKTKKEAVEAQENERTENFGCLVMSRIAARNKIDIENGNRNSIYYRKLMENILNPPESVPSNTEISSAVLDNIKMGEPLTEVIRKPRRIKEVIDLDESTLTDVDEGEISDGNSDDLVFYMPNYFYWTQMWQENASAMCTKPIRENFPKNFNWLLEECAHIIEMNPVHLYTELLVLENYFTTVLQPPDDIRNTLFTQNTSMTRLW